jgi:hypothetical protein
MHLQLVGILFVCYMRCRYEFTINVREFWQVP